MQVKGKPDKTSGKLAANRTFFTPPIARIINSAVERKDCFIDFDNDKLYSQPSDFHSRAREQQEAWKRENSIDASATVSEGAEGLWGEEMVIIPLADVEFDRMTPVSFRDVLQQATPGTPAVMTAIGQLPKTYVFKTREGGMGLLQILEVQRKRSPHYIKIRYKMVPRTVEADAKITSNKKLQDLGKAMVMFATDHQRKLPDSLQDFAPYLRNKRDIKWLSQKVKYLGKGKTENDRPDTVIAYDSSLLLSQQGTNVLFLDAHVEYVQPDRLKKLSISKSKKEVIRLDPSETKPLPVNDETSPEVDLRGTKEEKNSLSAETDGAKAKEGESGEVHVVHFPADRSVGQLSVQDVTRVRRITYWFHWGDPTEWEYLCEAKGDVHVPAGKRLSLTVNKTGWRDLSWLTKLRSDDLYRLSITVLLSDPIKPDDRCMPLIAHLTGLKFLALDRTNVTDRGFKYITNLASLEYLGLPPWVTDRGMAYVAQLPLLKGLYLGEMSSQITDAGLRHLTKLNSLEELYLTFSDIDNFIKP
ncbi:hypothetical protein ES703_53911 [subsurface metagenome]